MILEHYSRKRVRLSNLKIRDEQPVSDKPSGFWVSVKGDMDWPAFFRSEQFSLESWPLVHTVNLRKGARILLLDTEDKVRNLYPTYTGQMPGAQMTYWIDWPRIAQEYSGVIIAPYQWKCRLDRAASWYYTWDCASGCIWDPIAIESISDPVPSGIS